MQNNSQPFLLNDTDEYKLRMAVKIMWAVVR